MPATDPFSRVSRASEGFDTWATGAAGKQSVGLASLPGLFLFVLALVRQIRLLFNAAASACHWFSPDRRLISARRLVRGSMGGLRGSRRIQDALAISAGAGRIE